jgi:hypothetical protein
MKVKRWGWAALAGVLVLLVSSSALAGSTAEKRRFQNSFVCVNIHNGLIKVISRRQHNRCAAGWKRYRVSDIFGKGMRGAKGAKGAAGSGRNRCHWRYRRYRRYRRHWCCRASGSHGAPGPDRPVRAAG